MKPELRGHDFRIGDVLHDAWAFDPKLWRGSQMGVAEGELVRIGLFEHDAATLLHAYQPQIEPLLAELGEHLSDSDLAAARTLVAQLQRRFEPRFGPHQGDISGHQRN